MKHRVPRSDRAIVAFDRVEEDVDVAAAVV
jgi:hypothetical protein